MSRIIDPNDNEVFDGIRKIVSSSDVRGGKTAVSMVSMLRMLANFQRQDLKIPPELFGATTDNQQNRLTSLREEMERYPFKGSSHQSNREGQRHLELDEATLQSTGKSVSVEEVIAQIDEALK